MNNKAAKRTLAVALAGAMAFALPVTAFADGETSVSSEGTATYEGDKIENDVISLELPTIAEGTYNYTADPNGLLSAKDSRIASDNILENKGILFQYESGKYGPNSTVTEVTSESAVAVDVTVTAKVKGTYDGVASFAEDDTFKDKDDNDIKDKTIYLAVVDSTDDDATKHVKDAIKGTEEAKAAKVTSTIAGVPDNFELVYADNKYSYAEVSSPADYNKAKFNLTGAINPNAEWTGVAEKGLPDIEVTWSYAKHSDGPVATPASISTAAKNATISGLADGATLKSAVAHKADGTTTTLTAGNQFTYSNNTFTTVKDAILNSATFTKIVLTFSDDSTVEIPVVAAN